jgi:hypothetical protein
MKYTVCTNYPSGNKSGLRARPNVDDMMEVVKLRLNLEVGEGPYVSGDNAKICFITNDAVKVLALLMLFKDRGVDSYWYNDDPSRKQGDVCHFGETR